MQGVLSTTFPKTLPFSLLSHTLSVSGHAPHEATEPRIRTPHSLRTKVCLNHTSHDSLTQFPKQYLIFLTLACAQSYRVNSPTRSASLLTVLDGSCFFNQSLALCQLSLEPLLSVHRITEISGVPLPAAAVTGSLVDHWIPDELPDCEKHLLANNTGLSKDLSEVTFYLRLQW